MHRMIKRVHVVLGPLLTTRSRCRVASNVSIVDELEMSAYLGTLDTYQGKARM